MLAYAPSDDAGLQVGPGLDDAVQAGRSGPHDSPEAQPGAAHDRLQLEAPAGAGVVDVVGAPAEGGRLLEHIDEAVHFPVATSRVVVAADEAGAQRRAAMAVLPLCALELLGELRRKVDVGDVGPHDGRVRPDVGLGHGAGAVGHAHRVAGPPLKGAGVSVEVGDLAGRVAPGRLEVGAGGPRHREHGDLGHVLRNAQQLLDVGGVDQTGGGPDRAQAPGPQGHTEAPAALDHRVEQAGATAAVVAPEDQRDDDGRHLAQMLGQVGRGPHGPLPGIPAAGQTVARLDHAVADHVAVQLGQALLDAGVAHDEPPPAALVPPGGSLLGDVDAVQDDLVVHVALKVEAPPHRPGGGEHMVDGRSGGRVNRHGQSPSRSRPVCSPSPTSRTSSTSRTSGPPGRRRPPPDALPKPKPKPP